MDDEVDCETSEYLQQVSASFAPLSYAFAYGSGMFKQHGHEKLLVVVVERRTRERFVTVGLCLAFAEVLPRGVHARP